MYKFISSLRQKIQTFIDKTGMYRMVSGSLLLLTFISIISGFWGWLYYSGSSQIIAVVSATVLALVLNYVCAKLLNIPANHESAVITALILFFLVIPADNLLDNWPLWLAVIIAILSKFILVFRKQHIFNAAALGAVTLSLSGTYVFSWWVGNPTLFIPVLILGTLVVMKIRKWTPVLWFVGIGLLVYLAESIYYKMELWSSFKIFFLSWPTLFLAFFMLTEPFTMPPTKKLQAFYGGLVGLVANTTVFSSLIGMTPELALIIGNLVVYPFLLRQKLFLKLIEKREIAEHTYEFIFEKPIGLTFQAGQYLEWMLPHEKPDTRGVRRYFTIASSPTENTIRLAMKVVENGSTYKKHLMSLDVGQKIIASQLAGDFLLPSKQDIKIGMIAGGIGVTPFRSHIQYLVDSGKNHDTKLFYCCNSVSELAYEAEFALAKQVISLEVISVINQETTQSLHEQGFITKEMLERRVPDFLERVWYVSGPPPMVNAYTKLLKSTGVDGRNIKCDFFPGLA